MFAFLKRPPISIALLLSLVLLGSYFFLVRNVASKRAVIQPITYRRYQKSFAHISRLNPQHSASLDTDNDGIPDSAEFQSFMDRENFRQWFTSIADAQYYRLSEQWNAEQRDCSGLVRFAWREALRRHDRAWFQKMGPGIQSDRA